MRVQCSTAQPSRWTVGLYSPSSTTQPSRRTVGQAGRNCTCCAMQHGWVSGLHTNYGLAQRAMEQASLLQGGRSGRAPALGSVTGHW